jgi:hypothetical protein
MKKMSVAVLIGFLAFAMGCAGAKGKITTTSQPIDQTSLLKYTSLSIEMNKQPDVPMTSSDFERLTTLVANQIIKSNPSRFRLINKEPGDDQILLAKLTFTRYDKGNAFARAMLIGLGQIHIDADLLFIDKATGKELESLKISKTFAMGGLYGATTDIHSVEDGFTASVAAAILGEREKSKETQ